MLFSSLEFIYLFLPLTLAFYFLSPYRAKNYVLLAASLCFYGIGEPSLLPLMLAVSMFNYLFGLLVYNAKTVRASNAYVAIALTLDVGVLFAFKYLGVLVELFGLSIAAPPLPTGISFYTFQAMSYVIDVRRRAAEAQRNPLIFTTYVALFPQLVAGPIVRYPEIDSALKKKAAFGIGRGERSQTFLRWACKKAVACQPVGRVLGENGSLFA